MYITNILKRKKLSHTLQLKVKKKLTYNFDGVIQQIIEIFEFPLSDTCKHCVNLLPRKFT